MWHHMQLSVFNVFSALTAHCGICSGAVLSCSPKIMIQFLKVPSAVALNLGSLVEGLNIWGHKLSENMK